MRYSVVEKSSLELVRLYIKIQYEWHDAGACMPALLNKLWRAPRNWGKVLTRPPNVSINLTITVPCHP